MHGADTCKMKALVVTCIRRSGPKSSGHCAAGHLPLASYENHMQCAARICSKHGNNDTVRKISSDDGTRQASRASYEAHLLQKACDSCADCGAETLGDLVGELACAAVDQ